MKSLKLCLLLLCIAPFVGHADPTTSSRSVNGTVHHSDGVPAVGKEVRVLGQNLRQEQILGKAWTDAQGRYQVRYSGKPVTVKGGMNLIVRVFDAQEKLLAESSVMVNAPGSVTINLVIPAPAIPGAPPKRRQPI